MSVVLEPSTLPRSEPETERRPNAVYALAQTVAGLVVPLLLLRIVRRVVSPRPGRGQKIAFLRPFVLFGLAAFWLRRRDA